MFLGSKRGVVCAVAVAFTLAVVAEAKVTKINESFIGAIPGLDEEGNLFEGEGEGEIKIVARVNKNGKGSFRASGGGETENFTGKKQRIKNNPLVAAYAEETASAVLSSEDLSLDTFSIKRSLVRFAKPNSDDISKVKLVAVGKFTVE